MQDRAADPLWQTTLRGVMLIVLFFCCWLSAFKGSPGKELWPAVVALVTIFISRQVVLGLALGALAGCLFLTGGDVASALKQLTTNHFFPSLQGPWRVGAILFTLILGSFAVVIERGGGFLAVARKLIENKRGNAGRRLETATGLMGSLCFFDGLANSLLLGKIMRPLADRSGITRAKLAYLVDSTSSSIACIAFISTWIATQLSLIDQSIQSYGITDTAYTLFFQSIGSNFYCLFTLALVALVIWRRWDMGPMKKSQVAEPTTRTEYKEQRSSAAVALVPILTLSLGIVSLFYLWETSPLWPVTTEKLTKAFSGNAGPYALTLGSLLGLGAATLMFPKKHKARLPSAVRDGAASMLPPLLILIMAWTFGSVMKEVGTARWLAGAIGSQFSPAYFPAAVFLTGACISFLTGSSWGTMALLMPIAIPGYLEVAGNEPVMLSAVIGAVFSGAVFGDHCSPFSDTTIVSAFSCGVSAQEHVITQLPYALLAAVTALVVGYLGTGMGLPAWACIITGIGVLCIIAVAATRKTNITS